MRKSGKNVSLNREKASKITTVKASPTVFMQRMTKDSKP